MATTGTVPLPPPPPSIPATNAAYPPTSAQRPFLNFFLATWLGNLIAGIGLIIGLASLALTAYSSAVQVIFNRWTAKNDALQSCLSTYDIGQYSKFCNETIAAGVPKPPVIKRETLRLGKRFRMTFHTLEDFGLYHAIWSATIFSTFLVGCVWPLILARQRSRAPHPDRSRYLTVQCSPVLYNEGNSRPRQCGVPFTEIDIGRTSDRLPPPYENGRDGRRRRVH